MSFCPIPERTLAIEKAFAKTHEVLSSTEARDTLGQRAVMLAASAADYFVPNLRGGAWEIPDSYADTDALPVIPSLRGEAVTLGKSLARFSPAKREQIADELQKIGLRDDSPSLDVLVDLIEEQICSEDLMTTTIASPVIASVYRVQSTVHINGIFEDGPKSLPIRRRPVLLASIDADLSPPTVTHELVHRKQLDTEATTQGFSEEMPDDAKELEAYQIGAILEDITDDKGVQTIVEKARQRHTHPDHPYRATRALRWHLGVRGLYSLAKSLK